jgi:cell division septum initiation protein DivIVA
VAVPATTNTPAKTSTPAPGTPQAGAGGDAFDTALRGYDRRQVDDFVAARKKEIDRLNAQLAEERRDKQAAVERADKSAAELREVRARSPHEPSVPEESFGFRAEKLLRMAEQEAVEIRGNASRESAAIVEQARKEAEQHRHAVEQTLISRASLLEQQAAQRSAELAEREQQVTDQLAAAREQVDQMHAAATRAADRLRQESEAAAEETRARAEAVVARQRDQANQEISRLTSLQSDVRSELARLAEVLSAELSSEGRTPRGVEGSDGATVPAGPARTSNGRGR